MVGNYISSNDLQWRAISSSYASWTPGACFGMCNKTVQALPMIDQNTFLSKSIIFIHTLGPKQGSNFMVLHNPYLHGLGLGCSPYAQPLKQGQENYQRYTLKDNLGQPSDP